MADFSPALLDTAPTASSYTPRSEHESSTPATFFGAQEVLYAELGRCDLYVYKADVEEESTWKEFLGAEEGDKAEEAQSEDARDFVESQWYKRRAAGGYVGSGALVILPHQTSSSSQPSKAISIPYPSISIHAVRGIQRASSSTATTNGDASTEGSSLQQSAIYLQIESNKGADREDQDESTVEVLIVPTGEQQQINGAAADDNKGKVQEIYEALCACAELHPDPVDDEDGRGGIIGEGAEGAFGAGGWITSENVHEFEGEFPDEDVGGVDGGEGDDGIVVLGPGAGSRRARAEDEEEDESKWQRTA